MPKFRPKFKALVYFEIGLTPFIFKSTYLRAVVLGALLGYGTCQKSDEYTDENRPYEFGFLIDGEQHRYEKKDEKGIIMGEYGFITADGVYHVTVYATDENGNFIILKTRNIRIGLHMPKPTTTSTTRRPEATKFNGFQGCSGCLIPEKIKGPQGEKQQNLPGPGSSGIKLPIDVRGRTTSQEGFNAQVTPGVSSLSNVQKSDGYLGTPGLINIPKTAQQTYKQPEVAKHLAGNGHDNGNQINPPDRLNNQGIPDVNTLTNSPTYDKNFNASSYTEKGETKADDTLNKSPQMNKEAQGFVNLRTPGTTPHQILTNTEMKILDFMARLYKFNYTLSFHGHEEEGDVDGNKKGSYFNNGRDGYQRKVVYLANEFGYQPVITMESLNPADTPNENTEKELTQLKGSEFIWFYNKIKDRLK